MNLTPGLRVRLPEGAAFAFLDGRTATVEELLPRSRVRLRPECNPRLLVTAWAPMLEPLSTP